MKLKTISSSQRYGIKTVLDVINFLLYKEAGRMYDLCRDFDKGKCSRGRRCKYYHPKLKVCRDSQNKKCEREKCRFLHITCEEEELYEKSGKLPDHIDKEEAKKRRVVNKRYDGGQEFHVLNREVINATNGKSAISRILLVENKMLNLKIMELKQEVTDLRQMNDFLYEQNTTYHCQLRGMAGGDQQTSNLISSGGVTLGKTGSLINFV